MRCAQMQKKYFSCEQRSAVVDEGCVHARVRCLDCRGEGRRDFAEVSDLGIGLCARVRADGIEWRSGVGCGAFSRLSTSASLVDAISAETRLRDSGGRGVGGGWGRETGQKQREP